MSSNYKLDFTGKTCLVTGGAGFIGSNLARSLVKLGADVKIIDNFSTGKRRNIYDFKKMGIEIFNLDITNEEETEFCYNSLDFVFHHAAIASVPYSVKFPEKSRSNNVGGIISVLRNSSKMGIDKVVFASSSSVYGDTDEVPTGEKVKLSPQSPYARQKREGELLCKDYSKSNKIKTTSLRYFNVFGPYQDPDSEYSAVIPKFIKSAIDNEDLLIFGDGSSTRDFVFVEDVIQSNLLSVFLESSDCEEINIAGGQKITISNLAKLIIEVTGSKSQVVHVRPRNGDILHSVADITKANEILGYNPHFSLEEGLLKTVEYFKRSN